MLVVLDESAAARRVVSYLAKLICRQRGFQLCLAHLLPPPAGLQPSNDDEGVRQGQRQNAPFKPRQQRCRLAAKRSPRECPLIGRCRLLIVLDGPARLPSFREFPKR